MKKSDELKKAVNELTEQITAAQAAEDFTTAEKLADELTAAAMNYKAEKAKEEAEMETFTKQAAPVKDTVQTMDAKTQNRIFNKLVFERPLDSAEREIYAANRAAFNVPGTPGQVEATPKGRLSCADGTAQYPVGIPPYVFATPRLLQRLHGYEADG